MRRAMGVVSSLCLVLAGCSHWYGRGALAVGGGTGLGLGVGVMVPCPMTEPDCHDGRTAGYVAAGGVVAGWAIMELVLALYSPGSGDGADPSHPSSGSSSGDDDDAASSCGGDDKEGGEGGRSAP